MSGKNDKETKKLLKNLEMKLQESERKMDSTIDTSQLDPTQSIKRLKEALEETKKKIKL